MRRVLYSLPAVAFLAATLAWADLSYAEKRAFVVGVNSYDNVPKLQTAVNDARTMSEVLKGAGFQVTLAIDPGRTLFFERWREFLSAIQKGDSAAFYFAGHGFQLDGANYLVPKDVPGVQPDEQAFVGGSVKFYELMEELESRSLSSSLYILDACRTSPSETSRALAPQGQAKGLAAIESVYGAFVMYSAGVNEEALDFVKDGKQEGNSVYIRRLAPLLKSRDLQLRDVAARVRVEVDQDAVTANHKQRPAYFDGILGSYFLNQVAASRVLDATSRIPGANVIRLGGFATFDDNCKTMPAPRVSVSRAPRYGRILTRFESFSVAGVEFGPSSCVGTQQRGVGVYYVLNEDAKDSRAIESIAVTVRHWSISPAVTTSQTFNVDLVTRQGRRVKGL